LNRNPLLSLVLAATIAAPAWALDVVPYEADGFARARSNGRVTAVQFHSGWCPVCVMQERGVRALKDDRALAQVTVFQADYFKEEALRKRFNVSSFSTLVVFRGEQERARTTGDFQPEQLKLLFAKAL
jgi:thioredoxin 1